MFKWVGTEIVTDSAAYRAWWEQRDQLFKEHGVQPIKVYDVEGRTQGMVFFETPEFENRQEADQWGAQYRVATASLSRGKGVVLPGSCEFFNLTDY
jgi:hypothetical protein